MSILKRRHWIFDLDGTLTCSVHDFDVIREQLGLPEGSEILETLSAMPEHRAHPLWTMLEEIEFELTGRARAAEGAVALLERLRERGFRLGVLPRNSHRCARETLRVAGLEPYFEPACVLGREAAPPKPRPEGVLALLSQWRAPAADALVVGDYLFDLLAGRAAGTATVYIDETGEFPYAEHADLQVERLDALLP
ncbi:MAG: HAD family hydrolase [Planctomycetota bacterium]|jgi:HAD superfamily hydrolase (TIGR01509 family)